MEKHFYQEPLDCLKQKWYDRASEFGSKPDAYDYIVRESDKWFRDNELERTLQVLGNLTNDTELVELVRIICRQSSGEISKKALKDLDALMVIPNCGRDENPYKDVDNKKQSIKVALLYLQYLENLSKE